MRKLFAYTLIFVFTIIAFVPNMTVFAQGPKAENVRVVAIGEGAVIGEQLEGQYDSIDADESLYLWLRSFDGGINYIPIEGATLQVYTITKDDVGAFIKFQITPISSGVTGEIVISESAATVGNMIMSKSGNANGSTAGNIENLTDGSLTTALKGGYSGANNVSLMIDLGQLKNFNRFIVYANQSNAKINKIRVQYSNNVNPTNTIDSEEWTTIEEVMDDSNWKSKEIRFPNVEARYIRLCVTGISAWTGAWSLREFELYNSFENPPTIVLNGDEVIKLKIGETYIEQGATATDQNNNNLTKDIKITGAELIDNQKEGEYTVFYIVKDISGNVTNKTRKVIVYSSIPTATDVKILPTKSTQGGSILKGSYKFSLYLVDESTFQWFRTDASGKYVSIENATDITYTIGKDDIGRKIKFSVIPTSGGESGVQALSSNCVNYGSVTLGKNVYASSDPKEGVDALVNVTDGDDSTGITGGYSGTNNYSIMVDLVNNTAISKIIARSSQSSAKITNFKVEYSNVINPSMDIESKDWILLESREDKSNWKEQVFDFDFISARYIRFCVTGITNWGGAFSFRELEAFGVYNVPPIITLNGKNKINVELNQKFIDPMATAVDQGNTDISNDIIVNGDIVNSNKVGLYELKYNVCDAWNNQAPTVTRLVNVHNPDIEPPIISLIGVGNFRIIQNSVYMELGANVTDNIDDDLIVQISGTVDVNTVGEYKITYNAVDKKGNKAIPITRIVSVVSLGSDITQPIITLKGDEITQVWKTFPYIESGYTATDDVDGDITSKVVVNNKNVNTAIIGDYVITYFVSDDSQNQQIVQRIVRVVPIPTAYLDLQLLNLGTTDMNGVISDLVLMQNGVNGSTISWVSSDESVVRADGTVIRQYEDRDVKLVATATKDGKNFSKEFNVRILKKVNSNGGGGGSGNGGGGSGNSNNGSGGGDAISFDKDSVNNNKVNKPTEDAKSVDFVDLYYVPWATLAIGELAKRDIVNGTGSNEYEPHENVKREEFVKILVLALELNVENANSNFQDANSGEWYDKYIATASKIGLVNGVSDTIFGVGDNLTREEMAVMIHRAINIGEINLPVVNNVAKFSDDNDISDYAKDSVYNLQQFNVIKGVGDNCFAPKQNCTRAEVAKVVYEFIKYKW